MVCELTVVTPTTGRDTLAQCEASVAAQTVPCVHSVVVNHDGDYGNRARNWAVKESDTPYIAMLDDDDWYEPQFAEVMLEALKQTGADLVYCRSHLWGKETGECIGTWFKPFDLSALESAPYILANTIIAKREVFEACAYSNSNGIAYNADWRMYLDAAHKGFVFQGLDMTLSNYCAFDGAWLKWSAGGLTPAMVTA